MDYKKPMPTWVFNNLIFILVFLMSSIIYSQSEIQTQKIKREYNTSKVNSITSKFIDDYSSQNAKVMLLAKANGWKISETLPNGNYSELQDVGSDGTPLYYTTLNDNVSSVSRANAMYANGTLHLGIDGKGMKVGIWDAGVALTTHQEFDSRVIISDEGNEISSHATMVLGTMIASGVREKAKGVAYKANAITNDWRRDKVEVTHAAAEGLLLSNHSYGIRSDRVPDWYFGSYIKVSKDWDNIMYNLPYYLMVTAAGNTQKLKDNEIPVYGTSSDGFDLMLGFTASKNGIVVAAADTEIDSNGNLLEATIATYSSFGPVDDGRIKPDIAGSGSNIFSSYSSGEKSYETFSGTSMASPGVAGSMLLLQQYFEQLNTSYMKAATLKGLTLHTADDVDKPGPDYKMGWGIMNTKKAAEVILNEGYNTIISEEELANKDTYSITVSTDGKTPLIASISWTDPAAEYINKGILNDTTPALVNDLDIRVTKDGETYYPWKLSASNASAPATKGDNRVDPYEKIRIDGAAGTYTIIVTHKNTLKSKTQDFSIIISGIQLTNCVTELPSEIGLSKTTEDTVTLEWKAITDAFYEVQYKEENTTEWSILYTNENSIELEELISGTTYNLRIRTFCTENIMSEFTPDATFTFSGKEMKLNEGLVYETLAIESLEYSIYPNPAVEIITLQGNVSKTDTYNILSPLGVIVQKGNVSDKKINVSSLSSGLYILTVGNKGNVKSIKFYKN